MATRSTREAVVTKKASNGSALKPQERGTDVENPAVAGFHSAEDDGSNSRCSERGSRSALGQSRRTRIQEKNELVNLNDRLAAYMDRVRELEIQNTRLVRRIETEEETRIQEVTSVKSRYEIELNNTRRAVDIAASENARLQLEANKWQADTEVLEAKLAKGEHKWSTFERQARDLEPHVADLQSRLNQAHARLKVVYIEYRLGRDCLFCTEDTYLGCANQDALNKAIGKVEKMSHNEFANLHRELLIVLDKPYMITTNIDIIDSLVNGAVGILKDVSSERDNLAKEMVQSKADLQDKSLCVAELGNKMNTLNRQQNFEKSLYQKELEEMRFVTETRIRETDLQQDDHYEHKGAELLQELREQYESEMELSREEVQNIYETKISDLQVLLERRSSEETVALDELKCCETRLHDVNARIAELESLNNSFSSRTRDLEQLLEEERNRFRQELGVKEDDIQRCRDEIKEQTAEFRDLLDTKLALDLEIAAYRTLLEGEESRMNISSSSSTSGSPEMFVTTHRGTKRRRTFMPHHEESNGD